MGIKTISLSDTIGVATPQNIAYLFSKLVPEFQNVEIGAHLHTEAFSWEEKVNAAYNNGCNRFDGAIKGFGGCPMAADELIGNMPTENLVKYFHTKGIYTGVDEIAFGDSMLLSASVFPNE